MITMEKNTVSSAQKPPIVWDFPVGIPDTKFRKWAKIGTGKLMLLLRPGLKDKFFSGHYPKDRYERAALASLVNNLKKSQDVDHLAKLHQQIWAKTSGFSAYESTEELLMEVEPYLMKSFDKVLDKSAFKTLVEIGCGTGKFLNYFSEKFPMIDKFIGIDISAGQIELNKTKYKSNPRLEFYAEDAMEWLKKNSSTNTVYVTYGGVLEYFNEDQVNNMLDSMTQHAPAGLVVFEPIADGFDPKKEKHSKVDGYEFNFSHPYPHFARQAGMEIQYEKVFYTDNAWWIILSAVKK
ncbi:class I SAM-dependent methyltransferase [Rhodonellum sp.]|uniref:class I SAM-dependent methyltransferase n=1 Tax=Rhodonellum sp. TaxID=2231180 RepID=UPI00272CA741|nr:class I SAM-dependent methyltransferase [Rhodonellum sp.]